ncbi:MAG: hypothetical protein QM726_04270 [Chitinophagaceae bacterium]
MENNVNTSSPASSATQVAKAQRNPSLFVFSAVFSLLVGFLPTFMPDSIKTWLIAKMGANAPVIWIVVFVLVAVVFIGVSYRLWREDKKNASGKGGVIIKGIKSGGTTHVNSAKPGDFIASDIVSGKDTEVEVKNNGVTDVQQVESTAGNTTIKTSEL